MTDSAAPNRDNLFGFLRAFYTFHGKGLTRLVEGPAQGKGFSGFFMFQKAYVSQDSSLSSPFPTYRDLSAINKKGTRVSLVPLDRLMESLKTVKGVNMQVLTTLTNCRASQGDFEGEEVEEERGQTTGWVDMLMGEEEEEEEEEVGEEAPPSLINCLVGPNPSL